MTAKKATKAKKEPADKEAEEVFGKGFKILRQEVKGGAIEIELTHKDANILQDASVRSKAYDYLRTKFNLSKVGYNKDQPFLIKDADGKDQPARFIKLMQIP
tara:strand:+ start:403 stop:708 length:306 start_codon:yes stop_codon:yes gene_type:complete